MRWSTSSATPRGRVSPAFANLTAEECEPGRGSHRPPSRDGTNQFSVSRAIGRASGYKQRREAILSLRGALGVEASPKETEISIALPPCTRRSHGTPHSLPGQVGTVSPTGEGHTLAIVPPQELPTSKNATLGMRKDTIAEEADEEKPSQQDNVTKSEDMCLRAVRNVGHIDELLHWMRPRTKDGDFFSSLLRLSVEVDAAAKHWSAYRSGCCVPQNQKATALKVPPPDIARTAEAASYLLRLTRCISAHSPMRHMLEPIATEILESVYPNWDLASFESLEEAELDPVHIEKQHPTFYAFAIGHKARFEQARDQANSLFAQVQLLTERQAPLESDLNAARVRIGDLEEQLASAAKRADGLEAELKDMEENFDRFRKQTRIALTDFDEVQHLVHVQREDMRTSMLECREKDTELKKLVETVTELTLIKHELEDTLSALRTKLEAQEKDIERLPGLLERLARVENAEAGYGIGFATRIVQDVFNQSLAEFFPFSLQESSSRHSKTALDYVCQKLAELPVDINELKAQVKRLKAELRECRQLIPQWNREHAADLGNAFDKDAPIHRQIYSMKDQRNFAALGTESAVPSYLRAEGFVRHVFLSKGEIEDFMNAFLDQLMAEDRNTSFDQTLTTEQMHSDLHEFMKHRINSNSVTEFAYAFICGLETFRDDPDFELFDLMLSGVVHPLITLDQRDMLNTLQSLLRSCRETGSIDRTDRRGSAGGSLGLEAEQVNRRIVRAVMTAVFPDKPIARLNALSRSLHFTLQALAESHGFANPECVFINDLFSQGQDGTQTLFIEEIRRQHCYEVIEFTCCVTRAVANAARKEASLRDVDLEIMLDLEVNEHMLREGLAACDAHMKQATIDQYVAVAMSDPSVPMSVREVMQRLRSSVLLKPQRLWVKATPKEVLNVILSLGSSVESSPGSRQPSKTTAGNDVVSSRRCQAVKTIENPLTKMRSAACATIDGLEKEMLSKVGARRDEPMDQPAYPPCPSESPVP